MEAINRNFLSNDLITIIFIIALVFVFLMKVYKPKYLLGYFISFFTQGFMKVQVKNSTSIFSIFYILLFFFTVIIVAVTLYVLVTPMYFEKNLSSLLLLLTCSFVYLFIKQCVILSIKNVFNLKKELNYLLYTKNGYLYTVCLWFFPVLIVNQYFIKNLNFLLLFITLLLVFRGFLILRNNKKVIFNNMFYFILYFCALELAPLLILYRTIN